MPDTSIPERPAMIPGMPCRLFTPHVSWMPSFLLRNGCIKIVPWVANVILKLLKTQAKLFSCNVLWRSGNRTRTRWRLLCQWGGRHRDGWPCQMWYPLPHLLPRSSSEYAPVTHSTFMGIVGKVSPCLLHILIHEPCVSYNCLKLKAKMFFENCVLTL